MEFVVALREFLFVDVILIVFSSFQSFFGKTSVLTFGGPFVETGETKIFLLHHESD